MKKTLLYLMLIPLLGISQNQFSFGFSGTTAEMLAAGWQTTNQSSPIGQATWVNATFTVPLTGAIFGSGNVNTVPVGQAGGNNSFALVNFNSTTGTGTISNWLITPDITVQNGDLVTFYSRKGTDGTTDFPDRLELRMSSAATTVVPSTGPTDVGTFTTVGVTINPDLSAGFVYPKVWTQYTYTVSGLSGPTSAKFAFRYFVTNGGPSGNNSDLIGIDSFSVDSPTASAQDFFRMNFAMYPNPAKNELNLIAKNGLAINEIQVIDLNGRIVKTVQRAFESEMQINVSDLTSGVYMIDIKTEEGTATSKFIKN